MHVMQAAATHRRAAHKCITAIPMHFMANSEWHWVPSVPLGMAPCTHDAVHHTRHKQSSRGRQACRSAAKFTKLHVFRNQQAMSICL